jgi:signal transduction histidine kinase
MSSPTSPRHERDELVLFRQIMDTLPIPVLLTDLDGVPVVRNQAAQQLRYRGPTPGERAWGMDALCRIDGTPCDVDDRPIMRSLHKGEIVVGEQMLLPVGNEQMIPVLVNSAPLRSAAGEILGVVASFENISAIKELERQKDDFLAAAAHDLRTPVTSVKGLVQLLERRLNRRGSLEGPLKDTMDQIRTATDRITRLMDQVLDVARLEMRRAFDLELAETDLIALLRRLLDEVQGLHPQHRVDLAADVNELFAVVDGPRIERVFANLLSNATKFSPLGGPVWVQVAREQDQSGEWAVISVQDEGIGIPPDELETIFNRFRRGSNVARRKISGTGIGLTYAKEVVEQHGGSIVATSSEGKGSALTVRLPLRQSGSLSS